MNAIILAAGLGSRFKEVTKETHKALLPINGIPNIERTIQYLKKANINDITIVTGYLSEKFYYLKDKYGCKLIYNNKYKDYNNIYSFYVAKDDFKNSFIIDSDVVLFKNIFIKKPNKSSYFVINRPKSNDKEWVPVVDNGKIKEIIITNDYLPSLLGISYWIENDSNKIKQSLNEYISNEKLENQKLYWDNIPMDIIKEIDVTTIKLSLDDAYEMDNLEHYNFILNKIKD